MARIRTIKPEFPQSESMGRVSRDARLLFIMLWTIADDFGRARANSRMLASLLFPYDDDAPLKIPEWLMELERQKCIRVYAIDGNAYLQIEKWCEHQKVDNPSKSKFPEPPIVAKPSKRLARKSEKLSSEAEEISLDQGPRTKDQGGDQGPSIVARERAPRNGLNGHAKDFDEFYLAYPRHVGREAAAKAYARALKTDLPENILAGAKRYAAERSGEDPKFTAHPATWLNAGRWKDETGSTGPPIDPQQAEIERIEAEHRAAREAREKEQSH